MPSLFRHTFGMRQFIYVVYYIIYMRNGNLLNFNTNSVTKYLGFAHLALLYELQFFAVLVKGVKTTRRRSE